MVHGAQVVHHIPGRLRVRLPKSKRDPKVLKELNEFIQGLGGVRKVEINPTTGSILVHYHPESHDQIRSLVAQAQANAARTDVTVETPPVLTEADDMAERIEKEAEFLAQHSELASQVVGLVKAINKEVRDATGNTVDLKVLLPAGLAVWAFMKAGADVATPLWVTLAIFSFNSFVAMHHPNTVNITTHTTNVC